MQTIYHILRYGVGQTRYGKMGLRHQQEQIFLAIDTQGNQRLVVSNPPQRKIQQRFKVLIAAGFSSFKGLNQVTQLSVKQCIDRRI